MSARKKVSQVPTLREREFAFLQRNRKDLMARFPGEWVVIQGDQIVAHALAEDEADEAARAMGVEVPFTVRIPERDEPPFIG